MLRKYVIILGVGIAYLIFALCTGWGIPCPFYMLTGFRCPACGVSRMLLSLIRLDFAEAFHHNALLLITLPLLLLCLIYPDVRYVWKGDRKIGWINVLLWIEIGALLVFGVVRNLVV